ncbi:protoheme IX farnesyltransferase [bacterium]|nr:protoheme IX farnesyltransferase [bacterium]
MRNTLLIYRELAKSGIVALVLISVLGGYLCGHPFERPLDWTNLAQTLFGVFFLAAGSSALNQVQERKLDALMPRTAKRPLPSGRISLGHALVFCFVTIVSGLVALALLEANSLFWLGISALVSYNFLYTLWWKRRWAFAAIPGAIPGALPILMGYAAASGEIWTRGGLFLFFVLFYWQMPHFWSLAIRFREDYSAGGIPTLPVARGVAPTRFHTTVWSLSYVALGLSAPLFLGTGWVYFAISILTGAKVLWELRKYLRATIADTHGPTSAATQHWLPFFLWINFSLILYVFGAAIDLWSVYVTAHFR